MRGCIIKRNKRLIGIASYKDPATNEYKQKWIYGKPYEQRGDIQRKIDGFLDGMISDFPEYAAKPLKLYLSYWIEKRKGSIAQTTYDEYHHYIQKHIIPGIGSIFLNKLKPAHIQEFYDNKLKSEYKEGSRYKGKTVLQMHRILRKALKSAVINGIIQKNPADYIEKVPKAEKYTPKIYTKQQFLKLLQVTYNTFDEVVIALAGGLGLRRSEIFGLKWSDIIFDEKVISIKSASVATSKGIITKKPKNETSSRVIIVPDAILDILKRYRSTLKVVSECVCDKYKPSTYNWHFRNLIKKHNLPYITPHGLRHTNATFMLKSGIPDKVASERLGHSTVSTTRDIYQHVLKEMDKEASEKLGNLFGK
jgi:integrase